MILSQFKEAVWHRRGSDCDIAEAWHHGGEIVSAVEAVLEFGEVAGYMLVADGAVSASDGALDVAEGGVDPLEGRVQGALRPEVAIFRLRSAAPWTSFNGDPAPSPIRWALGRGLVRMHPIRSFAVARMAGIGRL